MNKTQAIYLFFLITLITLDGISQEFTIPPPRILSPGYSTRTVPKGDRSLDMAPSANSEHFKIKFEFNKDSAFYTLEARIFGKDIFPPEESIRIIEHKKQVNKGEKNFFEIVPDISSNPTKMTLYIYYPYMTIFSYMRCPENYKIKYKRFKDIDNSKAEMIPLMFFYLDDENSNTEKLLDKYTNNNLITITSEKDLHEKIINKIEKCKLLYYKLTKE